MALQESNITTIRDQSKDGAVVFIHGFTGKQDDTWDRFPGLLGSVASDWDIFTIGYATTLLPDVVGIWSADPDLPILSTMLCTELGVQPFSKYKKLVLVAHSMGGLVVQKALVDDQKLAQRVRHVVLFGTPSAGLRKAGWMPFWKRQLKNMAYGSAFITQLRTDWKRCYGTGAPFNLLTVAGASDQFVPPSSSLDPFDKQFQRVVMGDHLSIVKPTNANAPSLSLLAATLAQGVAPAPDALSELRLAAEQPDVKATALVQEVETATPDMSVKVIVDAALALERAQKRNEAIALLDRYKDKDTDIKGTLAGRYKRIWLETEQADYARRSLALYEEALKAAQAVNNSEQIYYHAINVAFLKFTFANDTTAAQAMATLAFQHASPPDNDVWKTATVAEANLYLGKIGEALEEYRRLLKLQAEPWKHQSASLQAGRIAAKLRDAALAEQLESIFTPGARRVNKIFISYSHKDKDWIDRLKVMLSPYLRHAEVELELWDDTLIQAGQQWNEKIQNALKQSGVAVVLVSADFLASDYVLSSELPVMISAADKGDLQLLWVYISAAGWQETELKRFQATHDTKTPLAALPKADQDDILNKVSRQIKEAALRAVQQFKSQAAETGLSGAAGR